MISWNKRQQHPHIKCGAPNYDFNSHPYITNTGALNQRPMKYGVLVQRQQPLNSVHSLDQLGHQGDMTDDSADSLQVISAGSHCEQVWHGQGCPLFDVVYPAFPLPTTASPILQGALKNGWGGGGLSWRVTCPNHESFRLLTVARRGSYGPTRKLILLCTQSLVLCSK